MRRPFSRFSFQLVFTSQRSTGFGALLRRVAAWLTRWFEVFRRP